MENSTHTCVEFRDSDESAGVFGPILYDERGKELLFKHTCTLYREFPPEAVRIATDKIVNRESVSSLGPKASGDYITLISHKENDQEVLDVLNNLSGQDSRKLHAIRVFDFDDLPPIDREETIVETLMPFLEAGRIPGKIKGKTYTFLEKKDAKAMAKAILNDAPEGQNFRPPPAGSLKKSFNLETHGTVQVGGDANDDSHMVRVVAVIEIEATETERKQMIG